MGTGERPIVEGEGGAAVLPTSWSDDGRFLLLVRGTGPLSNNDVLVLPLEGKHGPVPLLHSERNETRPRFSPDGRWIAYTSTESDGTPALHVARFIAPPRGETPTASSLRNGRRISVGGGTLARWSDDGRELVYLDPSTSTLMAASVDGRGEEFLVRSVEELFTLPRHDSSVASLYDLSRDGKRLLVTLPVEASSAAAPQPPTVVLNWSEELKHLVPTN